MTVSVCGSLVRVYRTKLLLFAFPFSHANLEVVVPNSVLCFCFFFFSRSVVQGNSFGRHHLGMGEIHIKDENKRILLELSKPGYISFGFSRLICLGTLT